MSSGRGDARGQRLDLGDAFTGGRPTGRTSPDAANATQPGEDAREALQAGLHADDGLVPRSLEHLMADAEIMSADVEALIDDDAATGPERARAIAIGLLIGAAVGLVIDAVLSNWLFQGI